MDAHKASFSKYEKIKKFLMSGNSGIKQISSKRNYSNFYEMINIQNIDKL